jgi:hypothetical protein
VETIAPTITSLGSTRVSLVDLRIDRRAIPNSASVTLRSGASCTARITTSITQDALLIPLSGFVTEENVTSVFLLTPAGRKSPAGQDIYLVTRRDVTIGASDVNNVEVTKGLAVGDTIVAGNLKLIRDGILVTLRQD